MTPMGSQTPDLFPVGGPLSFLQEQVASRVHTGACKAVFLRPECQAGPSALA